MTINCNKNALAYARAVKILLFTYCTDLCCSMCNINRPRRSRWSNFLSVGASVRTCICASVCPMHCGKTGIGPDAVWHHRSDGSRDEAGSGVWGSVHGKGYFLGANLGRAIVTNGDFTAYVCDSAATRPSSQITLCKLVSLTGHVSLIAMD